MAAHSIEEAKIEAEFRAVRAEDKGFAEAAAKMANAASFREICIAEIEKF